MEQSEGVNWTVIILTCQYKDSVQVFQRELEVRQRREQIPAGTMLLAVEDPQTRVGSGGATLNALLVAAEHLSARAGFTVVTSDVLHSAWILILHMGRDFPFDDCGRAFTCLPVENPQAPVEALVCNLDCLLDIMTHRLGPGSPPGVWVCSTDMLLSVPPNPGISWDGFRGARVIAFPGSLAYALNHGVYLTDSQGLVLDIYYQGTKAEIQRCVGPDGLVPLVSGVVFFSVETAEHLLATHVSPPLDACTYMGLDSGAQPVQLSLFFDILLCMARNMSRENFLAGRPPELGQGDMDVASYLKGARAQLWRELRDQPLTMVYVPDGGYSYMTTDATEFLHRLTMPGVAVAQIVHSQVEEPQLLEATCSVVSCLLEGPVHLGPRSVLQHCHLRGPIRIGAGCFVSGLDTAHSEALHGLELHDVILQGHHVRLHGSLSRVFTLAGRLDSWERQGAGMYLNMSWNEFFKKTGIRPALLVRAARHYEGAEQILIRQAVMTARHFVSTQPVELPAPGQWVVTECPARVDFSGGWSDTPPIAYELGGAVLGLAVRVDGRRPIGAKARRIPEPELWLAVGPRQDEMTMRIVCRSLDDLRDYCQPHAPGALLKAAFICAGIVHLHSELPLLEQLLHSFNGGFELHTWSELPHGSGLGTSSILAGAALAALQRAAGRAVGTEALIHAVLHLEQVLTTGGGWQDQVSGLMPGIKVGRSRAQLPLKVEVEEITVPEGFVQKKLMAPGCEPLAVQRMMDVLAPYAYGQSLAGAGGGGFLYLLTKEPRQKETLEAVLAKAEGLGNYSVHLVEVDPQGLSLQLLGHDTRLCGAGPSEVGTT